MFLDSPFALFAFVVVLVKFGIAMQNLAGGGEAHCGESPTPRNTNSEGVCPQHHDRPVQTVGVADTQKVTPDGEFGLFAETGGCFTKLLMRVKAGEAAPGEGSDFWRSYGSYDPGCSFENCWSRKVQHIKIKMKTNREKEKAKQNIPVDESSNAPSRKVRLVSDAPTWNERLDMEPESNAKDEKADHSRMAARSAPQEADRHPGEERSEDADAPPGYGRLKSDAPTQDVRLSDVSDEDRDLRRNSEDEGYAVTKGRTRDIMMRLQVGLPSVDAFASKEMRVCSRWWGKGSECPDPFEADWSKEELIWCNPPYKKMSQVVKKIAQEGARCVLIMPHWPRSEWFEQVVPMVCHKYWYPEGTLMFETEGGPCRGEETAVWAVLVDGKLQGKKNQETYEEMSRMDDRGHEFKKTSSSRRRYRRKNQGEGPR